MFQHGDEGVRQVRQGFIDNNGDVVIRSQSPSQCGEVKRFFQDGAHGRRKIGQVSGRQARLADQLFFDDFVIVAFLSVTDGDLHDHTC